MMVSAAAQLLIMPKPATDTAFDVPALKRNNQNAATRIRFGILAPKAPHNRFQIGLCLRNPNSRFQSPDHPEIVPTSVRLLCSGNERHPNDRFIGRKAKPARKNSDYIARCPVY